MGMMKNSLGALALVAMAGAADATTITLSQQDPNDIFADGGRANVTIEANGDSRTVRAGAFSVSDGVGNFLAWCLDIFNNVSLPAPYTITETPFSATTGTFTASVVDNLTRLFNTAYTSVDVSNNAQAAGFQLALWEVITESDSSFDVTSGDFQWTGGSTGARDFANEYLGMMSGPETEQFVLTFFESGVDAYGNQFSQNLVSVAPIPLPAGVWLLGAGLLGLVAVGRRRRNAAAA